MRAWTWSGLLSWLCLIGASAGAAPISEEPQRFVYQVYVRAFYDGSSSPDGRGDFAGLAAKADYLKDLGVGAVLLMPIFESTGGMGYIPKDYFRTDPDYGDAQAFRELAAALHARDIKIILDAPVNHISRDSRWFVEHPEYFYLIDDPCHQLPYKNWHKPWDWDRTDCRAVWFPSSRGYYYATFFSAMPDLKFYDFERDGWNEPLIGEISRYFHYWAGLGADGFRIDAAKHFVEGERDNANALEPRNLELLRRLLSDVRREFPDVSFLGEIWRGHNEIEPYLPRSLDMSLDFPFMHAVRNSVEANHGDKLKQVMQHLEDSQDDYPPGRRVVFASNHDMSRLMTQWRDDERKWRNAEFLTMLTPFLPLLYYGEELGMHGKVKRPTADDPEEYVRTINAFPWRGDDDSLGFPGGRSPIAGAPDNYRDRNLAAARADTDSVYNMIRRLAGIRSRFGISNATKLHLRQDLYGHVIGWTMVNPDRRCLTVIANFDADHSYTIGAEHAPAAGCNVDAAVLFREGADADGGNLRFRLGPYGKLIVGPSSLRAPR